MLSIKRQVPLAPFSTFRIGGPADFFAQVSTVGELTEALDFARENMLPVFVFSGGSNILFADRGFRGFVIQMTNAAVRVTGTTILADAGAPLGAVVAKACEHGLSGIERLSGIPGSFGGAIRGNAGAFGTTIGETVTAVKCYDRERGLLREFSHSECAFGYRMSRFKREPALVILSATIRLEPGEPSVLRDLAKETAEKRESKHPQDARCAGSFFMNPEVDDRKLRAEFEHDTGLPVRGETLPAGWLIDHVGLRGKQIGGAQISLRHPNYFINTGRATAEDVIMLASIAKQRVRGQLGIQLKEEVQLIGF